MPYDGLISISKTFIIQFFSFTALSFSRQRDNESTLIALTIVRFSAEPRLALKAGMAPLAPLVLHGVGAGGDHLPSDSFALSFSIKKVICYWR